MHVQEEHGRWDGCWYGEIVRIEKTGATQQLPAYEAGLKKKMRVGFRTRQGAIGPLESSIN